MEKESLFLFKAVKSLPTPSKGWGFQLAKKQINWFRETLEVGIPGMEEIACAADARDLSEIRCTEGQYSFYILLLF